MGAYLIDHPPARDQFRPRNTWRRHTMTGLTVLHTAESLMDSVGIDTGAEAVAEFIRRRSDPGSYHDLVDSDSWLRLVPLELGAYQDGTGSNGYATSISFACKTSDWSRMSAGQRAGFLRQAARAFADQQAWRRANGHPLTQLRYITKAQADAGESGFCCHGWRDPARRSDPGVAAPYLFPFDEFLAACRAELDGTPTPEDDMFQDDDAARLERIEKVVMRHAKGGVQDNHMMAKAILTEVRALRAVVTVLAENAGSGIDGAALLAKVDERIDLALSDLEVVRGDEVTA